jgi:FKBP-type peptidyl-prolyl cis-trans isomerase
MKSLTALLMLAVFAAASASPALAQTPSTAVLPGGTRTTDSKIGSGEMAEPGRMVAVHYTGWLFVDGVKGKKFDSSRDTGQPFIFTLGASEVILGWDEGVAGMKVGGIRTLIVPPQAGYGEAGGGDVIPPNATLLFEVELLAVR